MSDDIRIIGDKDGTIYAFASNITHYTVYQQVPNSANIHITYYQDDSDKEWYMYAAVNKNKGLSPKLHKNLLKAFPKTKAIKYQGDE